MAVGGKERICLVLQAPPLMVARVCGHPRMPAVLSHPGYRVGFCSHVVDPKLVPLILKHPGTEHQPHFNGVGRAFSRGSERSCRCPRPHHQ